MSKKKSWMIKVILVLAIAGIMALNLFIFPKVMVAAGNDDEGEVVEIVQDESKSTKEEVGDDFSQDQAEDTKEEKEISNGGNTLDPDIYSAKIKGAEVKASQKEDGVIWVMVDPDTAKKLSRKDKNPDTNLGILVVKPEKSSK
ncbi:MAG: hypothetical protein ACOX6S_08805 [Clostridia bacterium]